MPFYFYVISAAADFPEICQCSNELENDDGLQTLDKSVVCIPVYQSDILLDSMTQNRRKRSIGNGAESWDTPRVSRGRQVIKTIHLPSSFTPRLGRRRAGFRGMMMKDGTKNIVNLRAGSAFTPRLGRQADNPQMK